MAHGYRVCPNCGNGSLPDARLGLIEALLDVWHLRAFCRNQEVDAREADICDLERERDAAKAEAANARVSANQSYRLYLSAARDAGQAIRELEQAKGGVYALLYFDGVNWLKFDRDNLAGVDPSTLAVLPLQSEAWLEQGPPPGVKEYAEVTAALSGCPSCKKLAGSVDFWKGEAEAAREGGSRALEEGVQLLRERDEAVALERSERQRASEACDLLRAIWHGEGEDKWPGPAEFRRRVEALVGPPPPGKHTLVATYYGTTEER